MKRFKAPNHPPDYFQVSRLIRISNDLVKSKNKCKFCTNTAKYGDYCYPHYLANNYIGG